MSELPNGWTKATIGSLCKLENGRAFKPTEWSTSGVPIVRIQNLNNAESRFNYYKGEFDDRYHLKGGELLFAWSGTPGTSFGAHVWKGGEAVLNQHIFRVDFDESSFDKRFFRHAINQKLGELIDIAHGGVGLRHVTKGKFEGTEILIPPQKEQKRIADKLDSLLARVDACRDRLDRIPTILKRLRQSILASACSGKLTADWRTENPNVERSDSLSARIATERFDLWCDAMHRKAKANGRELTGTTWKDRYEEPFEITVKHLPELPSSWMWKSFDSFTAQFQYGPRFGEGEYTDTNNGIPTVRTSDMDFRGEITLNNPPRVVVADNALDHFILLPDDMVITRTGATIGKCALYSSALGPAIASAYLIRYRLTKSTTIPRFVLTVLMSPWGQENLLGGMKAVAQPNINTSTISHIPVPIPPVAEQIEIVRRVESLLAIADKVERKLEAGLSAVSQFVPSVLSKAFRGELVPQDPNDEPAEKLLKRIQLAKESDASKPRAKKSGKRVSKQKAGTSMLKRSEIQSNHLTDILRSHGSLTAEALWAVSKLAIDDFYDQLKAEEEKGLLKERRKKGDNEVRLLEVA